MATLTAINSAALADTTSLLGTFADYEPAIENLIPSTDSVDIDIYLQLQSGGAFQATGYVFAEHSVDTGSATSYGANAVNALALTRPGNYTAAAAPGVTGSVRIPNPAHTSGAKAIRWETAHPSPTAYLDRVSGGGWWAGGNGAITGFRLGSSAVVVDATGEIIGRRAPSNGRPIRHGSRPATRRCRLLPRRSMFRSRSSHS